MLSPSNILSFLLAILPLVLGLSDSAPSPKASTDLICHTNHASECYPSIFQPTERFEIIHDDQALPPGLHVRMNLATGVKEARLNLPEPETAHSDLVIIDEPHLDRDQALLDYEPEPETPRSRVRPPRFNADEAVLFHQSLKTVKSASIDEQELVPALTNLQDLCHSQDWGLALTKDRTVIHFLTQTLQEISGKLAIRSISALLIATAIQNNPEALSAALSHFRNDEFPTKPMEAVLVALMHERCPLLLTRVIFLLSSLCQDPKQRERFVEAGELRILLEIFNVQHAGQDERDKLRGKIANFVLDYMKQFDEVAAKGGEGGAYGARVGKEQGDGGKEDEEGWVVVDSESTWSSLRWEWEDAFARGMVGISSRKGKDEGAALRSITDAYEAICSKT